MKTSFRAIELDTLPLTNIKETALANLSFEYSEAFRICFDAINNLHPKTSTELHYLTYKIVREKTNLPSQLVEQARRFAWNSRMNGMPKNIPVTFDTRLFKLAKTERGNPVILLRTIGKRIAIPIKQNRNYHRFQDLLRDNWNFKSFLLVKNKIKAVIQKNFEVSIGETVVGIDVGSASLAAATVFDPAKNKVLKQLYFGRDVKHKRILFELRRSKLQSKNNCRARSRLKKIRRAERNFVKTRI
ncbi:MAG: hypothetical protein HY929_03040, partial [Euryarchaeota archaeon]|nr:hypothetical protein [Euryarchaeota archaeon]